jgi:hypothetical protein
MTLRLMVTGPEGSGGMPTFFDFETDHETKVQLLNAMLDETSSTSDFGILARRCLKSFPAGFHIHAAAILDDEEDEDDIEVYQVDRKILH